MRYVLINKQHEIISKYEVSDTNVDYCSGVAAKFYFMGRKQLSEIKFDELWSVLSEEEYENQEHAYKRKSSSDPNKRWWEEEKSITNDELT
tara:strand:+ start:1014 stop:1286 length:273 start_codon:yes stop_codon:yes gene_type:complete